MASRGRCAPPCGTSSKMIEPSVDWYGSYARRSAIADFLELAALEGRTLSLEGLADLIRDNRWSVALGERIEVPGSSAVDSDPEEPDEDERGEMLGVEHDAARLRAGDVLAVVAERVTVGQRKYPFSVDDAGRLQYIGVAPAADPYIRLLALTVAHATGMRFTPPPYQVFEAVVAEALSRAGFATTGIGALSRAGGSFDSVLLACCGAVGLVAYPDAAPSRVFANDEGADILTNVWAVDTRPGGLQLVGQVTCARSNDWSAKITEPKKLQWRDWLGRMRSPETYLAVPHHVEDRTRTYLMSTQDRDIFDRMRLCHMIGPNYVRGEAAIVLGVLSSGVSV